MPCPDGCVANFSRVCHRDTQYCVHGCSDDDYYKPDEKCEKRCPEICSRNVTGRVCELGGNCIKCPDGLYGDLCNLKCSERCVTCQKDALESICVECIPGWFGKDCDQVCSENCAKCHPVNGICTECYPGLYGTDCSETCPKYCPERICDIFGNCGPCPKLYWGPNCMRVCNDTCKDACDQLDGTCYACTIGQYGHNCGQVCPKECAANYCHPSNGICLAGCDDPKYTGDFCDTLICPCGDDCDSEGNCRSDGRLCNIFIHLLAHWNECSRKAIVK